MSVQIQEFFIQSVVDSAVRLADIGFTHCTTERKGYATYMTYRTNGRFVRYMLGPADWHVEISITTDRGTYEMKDLFAISSIAQWIDNNKFVDNTIDDSGENKIRNEIAWLTNFIRFIFTKTIL